MTFDPNRVRRSEWIAGAGALFLLIVMFLDWFAFHGSSRTRFLYLSSGRPLPLIGSAWHAFSNTALVLALFALAALALAATSAAERRPSFPLAAVVSGFGVLMTILVVYRLFVSRPGGNDYTQVAFGGYLGLIAVLIATAGAVMVMREDGIGQGSSRPSGAPPPA